MKKYDKDYLTWKRRSPTARVASDRLFRPKARKLNAVTRALGVLDKKCPCLKRNHHQDTCFNIVFRHTKRGKKWHTNGFIRLTKPYCKLPAGRHE